ncbi:MAG: hypothetical protein ACFFD8_00945 [Candidatus Thorarchaeota archaeon]
MRRDGFYIIRCPNCGRYTYAPMRQKTRLCVYCQRIFKINPLNAIYVTDAETARARVKLYQAGKHHQEFMKAVEKSRTSIQSLLPEESVKINELRDEIKDSQPVSSRRRELERILYQHARTAEMNLQSLEEECHKAGIPWEWATQQIEALIQSGQIIAPKPWQIRLVVTEESITIEPPSKISSTKLARKLGEIIRSAQKPLSHKELLQRLPQESLSSLDVDEALNMLRVQGYILKTASGDYKWIAD